MESAQLICSNKTMNEDLDRLEEALSSQGRNISAIILSIYIYRLTSYNSIVLKVLCVSESLSISRREAFYFRIWNPSHNL